MRRTQRLLLLRALRETLGRTCTLGSRYSVLSGISIYTFFKNYLFRRESVHICWFTSQMPAVAEPGTRPKPGTRNSGSPPVGGKNPTAWSWRQVLNPGTQIWVVGILTTRLNAFHSQGFLNEEEETQKGETNESTASLDIFGKPMVIWNPFFYG